jgi:hypothetical protein
MYLLTGPSLYERRVEFRSARGCESSAGRSYALALPLRIGSGSETLAAVNHFFDSFAFSAAICAAVQGGTTPTIRA